MEVVAGMLYDLLPEIYRDEETFKFVSVLENALKDVEFDINKLWALIDPDKCPREFLPYLAKTLGWELIGSGEESWRLQVRYAQQILKAGGRAQAIVFLLYSFGLRVKSILQVWKHILTGALKFVPIDKPEQRPLVTADCTEWCPTTDILIGVEPIASWSESYWRVLDEIFTEAKIPIHVKAGFALTTDISTYSGVGALAETSGTVVLKNEFKADVPVSLYTAVGMASDISAEVLINA